MRNWSIAVLLITIAAVTRGAETRVLVPIYFEQPVAGAFGSLWEMRFAVHNASPSEYMIAGCAATPANLGCPAILLGDEQLHPNETHTTLPARYPRPSNGVSGAVIYLGSSDQTADAVNDLSFELRVTDLSRTATNAGTEVPVVRERAFRSSRVEILDVPSDPRFRSVLRLFEMNLDNAGFVVRVFDQATNVILLEKQVTTATPPQGVVRFQPGFAQVSDLTAGASAANSNVRVEIRPLTAGVAFWAYVSVTNNESQQVTLVSPQ